MAEKQTSRYIHKLRSKYKLIIYNDITYAEVWNMRLSRLNVLTFFGVVSLLIISAVVSLIAFTPLREFIPGYPDSRTRYDIVQNALRLDSLEQKVQHWVLYNDNINRILSGKEPIDIEGVNDTALAQRYRNIVLAQSIEDSLFRKQVEEMEQFNLTMSGAGGSRPHSFASLHFFPPLRGNVLQKFEPKSGNFGVSIVAAPGSAVMAALGGTVVAAYWTLENSYVIYIQHELNVITVYKNNGQFLKKIGQHVNAGETIAMTGAGKNITSFIFEIWNNGSPVNPEQYIVF
jgi:murein DD-endopeptidase MepM/ murein hydrolase activator NlpD